jgi:hypothetical protein
VTFRRECASRIHVPPFGITGWRCDGLAETKVPKIGAILQEKAALVILDGVWRSQDLAPFLAESPRSRLLFTTRDANIASAAGDSAASSGSG